MLESSKEIKSGTPTPEESNPGNLADDSPSSNTGRVENGLTTSEETENNGFSLDEFSEFSDATTFHNVKRKIDKVYFTMKEDLELLASKRSKFMLMSQKVNDVHFLDVIKLNVGGHIFQTSLQNLKKYPESTLAAMFSETFDLVKGGDGAYFIDRDGTHFRHILNFLRFEDVPPEKVLKTSAKEELMREAEFFGLAPLVEMIKNSTSKKNEGIADQSKANKPVDGNEFETTINDHCEQTQVIIDEIQSKLETGNSALQKSFEKLQECKNEYLELTKKVEMVHFPKVVKLNIGGQIFETNVKTLQKDPECLLATMFSEQIELIQQEHETYFIDRDGTNFRHVLNYLRAGKLPPKVIQDFGEELLEEALFYNIKGLVEILTDCLERVRINVGGSAFVTTIETLMKYPWSKLAQMLDNKVDGIQYLNGTYFVKRSSENFGNLLRVMEMTDHSNKDFPSRMTSKVLNEALFYEVNLFEKYASGGLFLSKILQKHKSHQKKLLEWCNIESQPTSMQLIYSAELDGWDSLNFHKNCDGLSPTLVLMESQRGNIFGGYTTKPWSSNRRNRK